MKTQMSLEFLLAIEKKAEAEINRKKLKKLLPGFLFGIVSGHIIMATVLPFTGGLANAFLCMLIGWLISYGIYPETKMRIKLFFLGLSPGLVLGSVMGLIVYYPNTEQFMSWMTLLITGVIIEISSRSRCYGD